MPDFGLAPWGVGEGGSDGIPPNIVYDPAHGATLDPEDPVGIHVTDNEAIASLFIAVEYPDVGTWEVVHDGSAFTPSYAASTFVGSPGDVEISVVRATGWHAAPKLRTYATDSSGNTSFAAATYALAGASPAEPDPIAIPVSPDPFADTDGLRLAVMISLYSDRRADADAVLPARDGDRRGWWADQFATPEGDKIGSHLWLLDRATNGDNVVTRAEGYARDALDWLIEDKVASKVDVAIAVEKQAIFLDVTIFRPTGDPAAFRFSHSWDQELTAPQLPAILL